MQEVKSVKQNRSSYILYCSATREQVKTENPDIKNRDILVELGKRWKVEKESNSDVYKLYVAKAEEDKKRFLTEKAAIKPVENNKDLVVNSDVKTKGKGKGKKKVESEQVVSPPIPEPVPEPVPAPVVVSEPVAPTVEPVNAVKAKKKASSKK